MENRAELTEQLEEVLDGIDCGDYTMSGLEYCLKALSSKVWKSGLDKLGVIEVDGVQYVPLEGQYENPFKRM